MLCRLLGSLCLVVVLQLRNWSQLAGAAGGLARQQPPQGLRSMPLAAAQAPGLTLFTDPPPSSCCKRAGTQAALASKRTPALICTQLVRLKQVQHGTQICWQQLPWPCAADRACTASPLSGLAVAS